VAAGAAASADKGLAAGTDVSVLEGAAESRANEEEEEATGEEEESAFEEGNALLLASGAAATAEFVRRVSRSSSCSRPCQYSWYRVMRSSDMSNSSPVSPPPAQAARLWLLRLHIASQKPHGMLLDMWNRQLPVPDVCRQQCMSSNSSTATQCYCHCHGHTCAGMVMMHWLCYLEYNATRLRLQPCTKQGSELLGRPLPPQIKKSQGNTQSM